ncbi:MAG: molybdopterin-synthase adenylyltransferase MoeB [Rubrobacteridae bacterium]|nr:molybdopterin-synthase adenylyltransferase MoeB [Rubrobacteridae bacterium]
MNEAWIERYSRHILLEEVGGEGQKRMNEAKVLAIGAGGLGSPALLYLAAAGIGTIGIVDSDTVDLSNLQRQVLHGTADVGYPKTTSAARQLSSINSNVKIIEHNSRLSAENIMETISDYDVILDGTDNFPTRFLVNDACVISNKPLIHGAILKFDGQAMTIRPGNGPCYRCIFPEPPPPGSVPSCSEAGILGAVAGIVGSIMAAEAIKVVLDLPGIIVGRILIMNALDMTFREVNVRRDPACPVCGENPTITKPFDVEFSCGLDQATGKAIG